MVLEPSKDTLKIPLMLAKNICFPAVGKSLDLFLLIVCALLAVILPDLFQLE